MANGKSKKKCLYEIVGFKENIYGSDQILLQLQFCRSKRTIFCFIEDVKSLNGYLSQKDINYLSILNDRIS